MNAIFSPYWIVGAAIWMFTNGLLHDIFILINHKGPYNRDLLRLLMDGHLLMLSGILFFISYQMMQSKISYGAILSIITAVSMLIYCAMIFPFLKSVMTTAISAIVLVVSIRTLMLLPAVEQIAGQK
jgi:hypothetical protein